MPGRVIYECKHCRNTMDSKDEYRQHYATHVDTTEMGANWKIDKTTANLLFQCFKCDLVVTNRQSHFAAKHQVIREKVRMCEECGASIPTLSKWIYHKRKHAEVNKSYNCPICDKTFARKVFMQAPHETSFQFA